MNDTEKRQAIMDFLEYMEQRGIVMCDINSSEIRHVKWDNNSQIIDFYLEKDLENYK